MPRVTVVLFLVLGSSVLVAQAPVQPNPQSPAEWQRKHDLALKHASAWDLYTALKNEAGSRAQAPARASLPDWSGIWTSGGGGSYFTAAPGGVMPKVTPATAARLQLGAERNKKGLSYDENLSECGPAGHPRWVREPFLREFVPTPGQTWLINEMVNEVRRIYTDGRGHTPEADRYPLPEGDSIGFWDGQKLVIHTNQLMARSMGRNQPDQSDQMETVEVWEKIDARTITLDVWLYDPTLYLEPWYFQRRFTQVPNPDGTLRVRYWDCAENPNNQVIKTPDGSTQFRDLTFIEKDKR
jgi:hypothetical protein